MRREMQRVRPVVGADGGYVYGASAPATRPAADYTPRVIPDHAGVAVPSGGRSNPMAAVTGAGPPDHGKRRRLERPHWRTLCLYATPKRRCRFPVRRPCRLPASDREIKDPHRRPQLRIGGAAPVAAAPTAAPAEKKRRLSAEGRARIVAASRKRWAAVRQAKAEAAARPRSPRSPRRRAAKAAAKRPLRPPNRLRRRAPRRRPPWPPRSRRRSRRLARRQP